MTDYPDFTVIARLKGEYAGLEKAVALDSEGALQTLLYGTYGGANKKILIDTDGNVRMNLYAQDLDEMVNRFKYGAPDVIFSSGVYADGAYREIVEIIGKGYIYSCTCYFDTTVSQKDLKYRVTMDGQNFQADELQALKNNNFWSAMDSCEYLREYDDINFKYRVNFTPGWTFETSYKIEAYHVQGVDPVINNLLYYTLI